MRQRTGTNCKTERLWNLADEIEPVLNGKRTVSDALVAESRKVSHLFRKQNRDESVKFFVSKILVCFVEASRLPEGSAAKQAHLQDCALFEEELRKLEPRNTARMAIVRRIATHARAELRKNHDNGSSPRFGLKLGRNAFGTGGILRNTTFSEELANYWENPRNEQMETNVAPATCMRTFAEHEQQKYTPKEAEQQYLTAAEHWSDTSSR